MGLAARDHHVALIAARLAREGWVPVDPLVLEAREIVVETCAFDDIAAQSIRKGNWDGHTEMRIALAALRKARGQ